MRVFLIWTTCALLIILTTALGNTLGVSKHIFTIWIGTIYAIYISFKRYNDEKYREVMSKTIIGAVVLFFVAIGMTLVEVYSIIFS